MASTVAGVWEFVNDDRTEVHEAAIVRLVDGATTGAVVEWISGGGDGPITDRRRVRIDGRPRPGCSAPGSSSIRGAPGDYAAICFIPGHDGIPHVMAGMLVEFTVDA